MKATQEQVLAALDEGRITRQEADTYLQKMHGTTLRSIRPGSMHAYAVLFVMAIVIVIVGFSGTDGLSGFVVFDPATDNATFENLTSISVTGTMIGEGSATFILSTNNTNYTVATVLSDDGRPRTSKASYLPEENVTLQNIRGNATYYLDDGNTTIPLGMPFSAPALGMYEILVVMNESGNISTARVALAVSNETLERTTSFSDECEQTCLLPNVNGKLVVLVENATMNYTASYTAAGRNLEPVMKKPIENITLANATTINLSVHFEDPEGDDLFFDVSNTDLVDAIVDGTLLHIVPVQPGSEQIIVYVSDLEHLVQEYFMIVVELNDPNPNATIVNTTNTAVQIKNETRSLQTTALGCDHPNPNRRPIECLQNQTDIFDTSDVFWENPARQNVAKINPLGNILIRGEVIEQTNATPDREDLVFGPLDRLGRQEPFVWIDADTGNLHVTGSLHEEQLQLNPPSGSYGVKSRKSLYLVYVDYETGDLYLRGNVIPLRRSIG